MELKTRSIGIGPTSCCDIIEYVNRGGIDLLILAHEFVEDSIQDFEQVTSQTDTSKINTILLCDEFEEDDAIDAIREKVFSEYIIARPLKNGERLQQLLQTAIAQRQRSVSSGNGHHKSVLIIEDDSFFSEVYRSALSTFEITLNIVPDCNTASDLLFTSKPELIFLDYNLPDFNGFELLRSIKSDPALIDIPVVVVTGESCPELNEYSQQIGANHFVQKPIKQQEIIDFAKKYITSPESIT